MKTKVVAALVLLVLAAVGPAIAGGVYPNCYEMNLCYYEGSTAHCWYTWQHNMACRMTTNQYGTFCSNLQSCFYY
jgi:hypothetical protein